MSDSFIHTSEDRSAPDSIESATASRDRSVKKHSPKMPAQRWHLFPAQPSQARHIAEATALSPLLAQVLINRGIYTPEQAWAFLEPESIQLPSPLDEFSDLAPSLDLLVEAIEHQQRILICGDYDADGMTSTALLMRSLRYLGAQVTYAIPSRMDEGYGINTRIVEEFYQAGGRVILTVDNGIAAYEPIALARERGLVVILTDHHDLPEQLPPANAILNPKLIRESSPYRGVAGVGVAYILAVCLAQRLDRMQDLTATLLALFTLGTIADLAPLTGVNRRWVKRGLTLLPSSPIPGIQALIEVAGLSKETTLRPEAIGFRLGPRINAVGRIADPQIVIDLLTTDDVGVALQRAMQCEEANQLRQQMCELIEAQAVEWCESQIEEGLLDLSQERVLVVVQPEWHHGVIGIVASRLVERYGVPVFIGTYEDKDKRIIRGSARSIPEFNVFDSLQFCDDLLDKYGGHRAAGGFSFIASKLRQVRSRLSTFARKHLQPDHLKPLVTVDAQADLSDVGLDLYTQIDKIHPCGIENPDPVFWTAGATVVDQKAIGKNQDHLKLTLAHAAGPNLAPVSVKAIAWRWGQHYPLPKTLDISYKLRLNEWRGQRSVELELIGVRPPSAPPNVDAAARTRSGVSRMPEDVRPDARRQQPSSTREAAIALQADIARTAVSMPMQVADSTQGKTLSQLPSIELPNIDSSIHPTEPERKEHQTSDHQTTSYQTLGEPSTELDPPSLDLLQDSPSVELQTPESSSELPPPVYVEFYHSKRRYKGTLEQTVHTRQLTIENADGHLLMVNLTQRQGYLYVPDQSPKPIDISEVPYFNLMQAALNALELKQKDKVLLRQQDLLAEKDRQIETLKAQMTLLEDKINQLSVEQRQQLSDLKSEMQAREDSIQGQQAHIERLQVPVSSIPLPSSEDVQPQVRAAVSDGVWFCLQPDSQKDLIAAYRHDQVIASRDPDVHIADYSEAGICLSKAIEREVLWPFFSDLYTYCQSQGKTKIGDVVLRADPASLSLSMMPPMLAEQWRSFQSGQLSARTRPESGVTLVKVNGKNRMSDGDRALVQSFLSQWEHPMADCFHQKGRQAASSLDQISKLSTIAATPESFLYRWQYELLHQLIAGSEGQGGLLRKLFGVT